MVSERGRRAGLTAALTAFVATPLWIAADEFWIDFAAWLPGVAPVVSNGLLPAGILLLFLAGLRLFFKKRLAAANNETIQASVIFLAVAFAILTVNGIWFRCHGMDLVWTLGSEINE